MNIQSRVGVNKMRHSKIFKRENGTQYRISIELYLYAGSNVYWKIQVHFRVKGKRKWYDVHDGDDYGYRGLSMEDRRANVTKRYLEVVTADEIHKAKLELWEMLKPEVAK